MATTIKAGAALSLKLSFDGVAKFTVVDFRQPQGGTWSGSTLADNQKVVLADPQPLALGPLAPGEQAALVITANMAPATKGDSVKLSAELSANGETRAADADSATPDDSYASLNLRFDLSEG